MATTTPAYAPPPVEVAPKQEKKPATKLSTSSPEAIRVAAEITSHRLANLLIRMGPLPIRLITAQLAVEVPGFDHLSLSKQRRLIMAAMEQGDTENNVVFEKIGWGQWAVRPVNSDYIVTEGTVDTAAANGNAAPRVSIRELKESAKLGWLKKADVAAPHKDTGLANRRRSITNNKTNLHNVKLPNEKLVSQSAISDSEPDSEESEEEEDDDMDVLKFRMTLVGSGNGAEADDNAIAEDSEEDSELFDFEDSDVDTSGSAITAVKKSPPPKFANRVPTKFSPPPPLSGSRRKSSSAGAPNSVTKNTNYGSTRHQILNRSRLNSIENLDNYIVSSAKNSTLSVSSPPTVAQPAGSVPLTSPLGSWTGNGSGFLHHNFNPNPEMIATALQGVDRRLSFNELSIRSTLSSSLPRNGHKPYENGHLVLSLSVTNHAPTHEKKPTSLSHDAMSDTDEEDWATIGAETLRKHSAGLSSPARPDDAHDEQTAARALVNLMGM